MKTGIVGLPSSGKTTLFKALIGSSVPIFFDKVNIGNAKVYDPNIEELSRFFKPKKTTFAEINFMDIPGVPKGSENAKRRNEIFSSIKKVDTVIEVVDGFTRDDFESQILSFDSDLILMDIEVIERRLERLSREKGSSTNELEQKILSTCLSELNKESPLRNLELSEDEINSIRSFEFFTLKPILYVINISDDNIQKREEIVNRTSDNLLKRSAGFRGVNLNLINHKKTLIIALPVSLEKDLSELEGKEMEEFMESYGLKSPALPEVVDKTMELMHYNVFYTTGEDEVRGWLFEKGLNARRVAGKIHSDIERGFIAAEVISFENFKSINFSFKEAKIKGILRIEGEKYIVKDKEIVHFRFNV